MKFYMGTLHAVKLSQCIDLNIYLLIWGHTKRGRSARRDPAWPGRSRHPASRRALAEQHPGDPG
ncbi:hypothetical protein CCP4SC76_340004 [Gammaproteobacteria bacterium]